MQVRTRVLLGYSPALVILASVLALMIASGSALDHAAERLYGRTIPAVTAGEELLSLARDMDAQAYRYVMAAGSPVAHAAMQRFDADEGAIEAHYNRLQGLEIVSGQRKELGRIGRALGLYLGVDARIRAALDTGAIAEAAHLRAGESTQAYDRLVAAADALLQETRALTRAEREANLREREHMRRVAVPVGLLALLLAAATGWRLANALAEPLAELRHETERIEAGEPASPAALRSVERLSELAALRLAIVRMAASLEHSNQALATANSQLEARVAERTTSLDAARRELEGLVAELRAVDQLKNNFMAIVSHELLTPLNFIEGFASALEDGVLGPLAPGQREAVGKIVAGSERLTRMVRNTLEYTQLESGTFSLRPAPLDYGALIGRLIACFDERARASGQTLTAHLPAGPLALVADADRLEQLLGELLDNAIKFNRAGGRLSVSVRQTPAGLLTEVCDEGEGIPEQALARLAMPFYQADSSLTRRHGGLGLGLAIAYRLSARMGGRLEAGRAPERGTCFRLLLPEHAG